MALKREIDLRLGSSVRLSLLSGHDQIGGTKLHIEQGGRGILCDFGLDFSRYGELFDEFNKPRAAHGIHDAWKLGILPNIEHLYRPDLMPIGVQLRGENLPVEALLITHQHQDHVLGIGACRRDLPMHMSTLTAAQLKSIQDIGQSDCMAEFAYTVPRVASPADHRALCSASTSTPASARPLRIAHGGAIQEINEIWNGARNSSSRSRQITPRQVLRSDGKAGPFHYEAWPVDHSCLGCLGYIVHTEEGAVCYTGDLRRHGRQGHLTDAYVARMAELRPKILVVEHTRVGRKAGPNTSEKDVLSRALHIAQSNKGKPIIVDFGGRHLERLASFLHIAEQTSRHLLINSKDAHLIESVSRIDPSWSLLEHPNIKIYHEVKAQPSVWEREILQRYQELLVDPFTARLYIGDLILAMSYWDLGETLSLDPKNLQYIYSSSEPYDESSRINLWRISNWVKECDGNIHGFRWEGNGQFGRALVDDDSLNASGHISEEDLEWLIKEVQPEIIVPCHGEDPSWFLRTMEGEPCRVFISEDFERRMRLSAGYAG